MKTLLVRLSATGGFAPGLLAAFAGCACTPTRVSTSEMTTLAARPAESAFTAPLPVRTIRPEYPWLMRRSGTTGVVVVLCTIDVDGRVHDATTVEFTARAFVEPALDALRQWTFQPATRDGLPVVARVSVPVNFSLNDN